MSEQTTTVKRCGQCGNQIPDWSGGVCPVCGRLSSGEKRFWKGGKKRPRPRQAPIQPTRPASTSPIERPRAKPIDPTHQPQTTTIKRPIGKQTRGRRRLDGFNRLLQDIYNHPVQFSHLLAEQGTSQEQIERWRQDGIWLVRFLKRLQQKLTTLLAEAEPDHDPRTLILWYGLDGTGARPIEAIAAELGITLEDAWTARWAQLKYLREKDGQTAFANAIQTAADETKHSYEPE